ncbi:hypothetical protein [Lysobacter sp. F60174L2]|uniref:hypothetical protein n=1 Tax=Lysobacter sp. F60174L2 TaxID=3459295 RepID=UPI00403D7390
MKDGLKSGTQGVEGSKGHAAVENGVDRCAALEREVQDLRIALGREESRRLELLSSTSWRITAPLRAVKTKGWKNALRGFVSRPLDLVRQPVASRPVIPPPLRALQERDTENSNETYRLVDATAALSRVMDAAASGREKDDSLRVFFLGSDELAHELSFDAAVTRAEEADWSSQLDSGRFDFLLVEAVWHAGSRDWRHSLVAEAGQRGKVEALMKRCHEISLPVVLWFREDLRNYDRFSWLARHVDFLYAVDDAIRGRLASDYPDKHVQILPVAIQPALHNPVQSYALRESRDAFNDQVLFDGWWELSAGASEDVLIQELHGAGLRICESEWEFSGVRLADCDEFSAEVVGCVDPVAKAALNKMVPLELFRHEAFRVSWRQHQAMLRAAACGSLVVHSELLDRGVLLPGIEVRTDIGSASDFISRARKDRLWRDSLSHRVWREIMREHCVADRLNKIAGDLGIEQPPESPPRVAMILVTMRPHLLAGCLDRFRADVYPHKELVVVLHGPQDVSAAMNLVQPDEPIRIVCLGRERSLGACLNYAIGLTDAEYWSKVDDDDLYGPNYLSDLMLWRRVVDFDVAGKPPTFALLEEQDALYWDPVWANHAHLLHDSRDARSALIAGGTITARREIIDEVPFSETRRGGSDSDFIRRCYESGHDVLAVDGFNFARYRSGQAGFHTWKHDNSDLLERAERIGTAADVVGRVFL